MPLAYLTGEQEFWGLALSVDERVLVPRPDTEILVERALECLQEASAPSDTGNLIALDWVRQRCHCLAMAHERPDVRIHACDVSTDCLAVAEANSRELGLPIALHLSDWFEGIHQRFDVIVANPPYIDSEDPHLSRLQAEPRDALIAKDRGLADLRSIIDRLPTTWPRRLAGTGARLRSGHSAREMLARRGFEQIGTRRDLGGNERVSWGQFTKYQADLSYG